MTRPELEPGTLKTPGGCTKPRVPIFITLHLMRIKAGLMKREFMQIKSLGIEATAETVKENDAVTLRCTTTCSLPHRVFSWYRNGHPVNETSAQLVIQRVSLGHHGSYSCQTGITKSPAFLLDVQCESHSECFNSVSPTTCAQERKSVTLNCKASANPASSYTWVKENTGRVGAGEHLHISAFNVNDAGSYHCEATNIHGRAKSAVVKLTVNGDFGTPANHSESHYPQMAKTWNSGEPSQEWPADQNYPKSAETTHPRGHKRPQDNV
uniref:Ig-like domain-containing protein n=1 Tax=Erpetoichthys calabaricus TaxID=27687 RepID=A0A8C4XDI4_ERPCA